ncbi:hypothetical protein TSOC_009087 [Tetrabaena socialis]|uniref:Uncharacterized protein n=1 Tax=Tetrabaena socialis TaxID=47790 RepID=A0A2J7ZWS3_9CHLO|nr:hypothetical protein TSOC_009087 [Tetrabaena socialis]|eukprot:PNH04708.1 hypothetical protein TSOC_009087 [Tetrabaena socialis]
MRGEGGSQDGRPGVAVLPWLAPQVVAFSQAHAASAEPLISSGQLVGRRVAFVLTAAFSFQDARAGPEVLPPGIYCGRVSEGLGPGCQEDVCGCGCPGGHDFFFVRVQQGGGGGASGGGGTGWGAY